MKSISNNVLEIPLDFSHSNNNLIYFDYSFPTVLNLAMSSQQQLGLVAPSQGTLGEVDHVRFLSENLSSLLTSDSYQDITLIVECQRIPAHKIILASRSEYFRYCGLFTILNLSF